MSKWRQHSEKLKKNPRTLSIPSCTSNPNRPLVWGCVPAVVTLLDWMPTLASCRSGSVDVTGQDTIYKLQRLQHFSALQRPSNLCQKGADKVWALWHLRNPTKVSLEAFCMLGTRHRSGGKIVRQQAWNQEPKRLQRESIKSFGPCLRPLVGDLTGQGGKGTHQKNCPLGMSGSCLVHKDFSEATTDSRRKLLAANVR